MADVNARDNSGRTPLMEAAEFENAQTIQVLLASKADIEARDSFGQTALIWVFVVSKQFNSFLQREQMQVIETI